MLRTSSKSEDSTAADACIARQMRKSELLRAVDANTRFRATTQLFPWLGNRPATRGCQGRAKS